MEYEREKKRKFLITVTITAPSSCCTTRSGVGSSPVREQFFTQINKLSSTAMAGARGIDGADFSPETIAELVAAAVLSTVVEAPELSVLAMATISEPGPPFDGNAFALSIDINGDSSDTLSAIAFRFLVLHCMALIFSLIWFSSSQ